MFTFLGLLCERAASEKLEASNAINTLKSKVYEHETVLAIHDATHASKNKNPEYQKHIAKLRAEHETNKIALPEHITKNAVEAAHASAHAYLGSLEKQGIKKEHIHEVHTTAYGIDKHVGEKTDRSQNPHDLIVKTKSGKIHGASLKETSGTLSNNGIGSFSVHGQHTKIGHNTSNIWAKGKKKAGLEGLSDKEIKHKQSDEHVKTAYRETQHESAAHHVESFNNAEHKNKVSHAEMLMKLNYNKKAPYDYVNAQKKSSTPVEELHHVKLLRNAKSLHAKQSGNLVHIQDEKGNKILTVEHRSTGGPFRRNQVNAKLPGKK